MDEWFNLNNTLYLIVLILGLATTVLGTKYRKIIKEISELVSVLKQAYADKKLTEKEKEAVLKEALDVLRAIIALKWRFR